MQLLLQVSPTIDGRVSMALPQHLQAHAILTP
jgi:hypothetical protein